MKSDQRPITVPLSRLVPSRRNPRKVKPGKEAHQRLVAALRSQGLLQPLVVRAIDNKQFEVVAGERRLKALREIHKDDGDPKIPCILRDVDPATADAMSLGENFAREAMHPLDEADAFAKLASSDGKDAKAIAAEFGVSEHYVRQRMKLATLAKPVKEAHRAGEIDTATAEAFAAVPENRQLEVWREVNGNPRHADHVRNIIANAWIDASNAQFDLSTLPESAISRDLFGDRVLVERQAFMDAQAQALEAQRQALTEEGWKEVVIGRREDVQDRLYAMAEAEAEYDAQTNRKLARIDQRWEKVEAAIAEIADGDQTAHQKHAQRLATLEAKAEEIRAKATPIFSEKTKSLGTSFLILDPDGKVHCEHRMPRHKRQTGSGNGSAGVEGEAGTPTPPTSDDLSDRQRAVTFTHQALGVRLTLLGHSALKRILVMILHDKIRSEALSLRHEANGTTIEASTEGFGSTTFDAMKKQRARLDPFDKDHLVDDVAAYEKLKELSSSKLDDLINHLVVSHLTAHMLRPTALVQRLADELKINVRDHWQPDAAWLSSFQKIQLAHLITELKGPVHAPAPESKKSALVEVLSKLFADAVDGKLEDKQLAERVNSWLPSNLRIAKEETASGKTLTKGRS